MAKPTRGSGKNVKASSTKSTAERSGKGSSTRAATAWAKASMSGPSTPPLSPPGSLKGARGRSGDAARDAEAAGSELATKMIGTDRLAGTLPHNPLKGSEYGEDEALDPPPGEPVEPLHPSIVASTLTETIVSAKVGAGAPPDGENATNGPLDRVRADSGGRALTTNQGVQVAQNQDSLKAGIRGPSLLEDFILREKITHFDHERIPERVVHARGSAAHGFFECTAAMTQYTRASFLSEVGKRTPVFVRFSTVAGERGSTDTARDVRGFATKFYTDEGNFDLVGNNIPVFFIQDAMKFPDLVHALKPEPHHAMPQAASAHDTFWDFVSLMPESTHMLMWVMSDRAIPRSYRMMQGFGVHTFRLVNADGESVFCKFHWTPKAGTHSLVWDEAVKISGADPDFHRRDLWEAIEAGAYPEWELGLQLFTEEQAEDFSFDVLDPTKIVPEELVPVTPVGRLVLNRNPDNFFAETEQVAFCTAHVVPGIDFSNDPLMQGRIHSYVDTQLTRLGGPNFHEIPINAPVAEVHNNQRDGLHRQTINRGRVAYEPNSLAGGCPFQAGSTGFVSFPARAEGDKVRGKPERFADHYTQATLFYRSQSPIERTHIMKAFRFELTRVQSNAVRERMVAGLMNVDRELAAGVAAGLGIALPGPLPRVLARPAKPEVAESPALSLLVRPGNQGVETRRIAVLVADGVNGAVDVHRALADAGAVPRFVAAQLGAVRSSSGSPVPVDVTLEAAPAALFDALAIPDVGAASETLLANGLVLEFIKDQFRHCKSIFALGPGASRLLDAAGLPRALPNGEPDPGVVRADGGGDRGTALQAFIEAVARHKHYARETDPPLV
jgi:catalase